MSSLTVGMVVILLLLLRCDGPLILLVSDICRVRESFRSILGSSLTGTLKVTPEFLGWCKDEAQK